MKTSQLSATTGRLFILAVVTLVAAALALVATPAAAQTTVVTTSPTVKTSTTVREKGMIEISCDPDPVVVGEQLTVSGGRSDGVGFLPGAEVDIRVDGDVLAEAVADSGGLFTAGFTVELDPGRYTFEAFSLGAVGRATCTVEPSDSGPGDPPSIEADPSAGEVGAAVTVLGSGYDAGDTVDIVFGDEDFATGVMVDDDGTFTVEGAVPDIDAGPQPIAASRGRAPEAAAVEFNVLDEDPFPAQPAIAVEPTEGEVGDAVSVSGSDYEPGDVVDVVFGGVEFVTGETVTGDGTFTVDGVVPDLAPGSHPVTVSRDRAPEADVVDFTVVVSDPRPGGQPSIALDPSAGRVGAAVSVSGSNYEAGDVVDIVFGGESFASDVQVTDDGTFSVDGVVPAMAVGSHEVIALRSRSPEAAPVDFTVQDGGVVTNGDCFKILGICWWWWLVILAMLLFLLWLLWLIMCRRRYPFHPGEPITGSGGWIAGEGKSRLIQGRCVAAGDGGCGEGCSCELFRRRMWRSKGRWERVESRQERFTYCYRCACARYDGSLDESSA